MFDYDFNVWAFVGFWALGTAIGIGLGVLVVLAFG